MLIDDSCRLTGGRERSDQDRSDPLVVDESFRRHATRIVEVVAAPLRSGQGDCPTADSVADSKTPDGRHLRSRQPMMGTHMKLIVCFDQAIVMMMYSTVLR